MMHFVIVLCEVLITSKPTAVKTRLMVYKIQVHWRERKRRTMNC